MMLSSLAVAGSTRTIAALSRLMLEEANSSLLSKSKNSGWICSLKLVVITVLKGVCLVGPVQNAGIHPVGHECKPDASGVIGHPAGNIAGILRDERELFGVEIDPVDVEDLRVALVHGDEHFVVVVDNDRQRYRRGPSRKG